MAGFLFRLETADGMRAEPPTFASAVPNWRQGDVIPLGRGRTLRVVCIRDDDADQPPVLVVEKADPLLVEVTVGPGGVCLALKAKTPSCGYRGRRQPAPPVACSAAPALVLELALSALRAIDLRLLLFDVCAVAAPTLIIKSQPWPVALGTSNAGEGLNAHVSKLFSRARDVNRPTLTALERVAAGDTHRAAGDCGT